MHQLASRMPPVSSSVHSIHTEKLLRVPDAQRLPSLRAWRARMCSQALVSVLAAAEPFAFACSACMAGSTDGRSCISRTHKAGASNSAS
eukprot:5206567-Pleurochrysis_carterae.AAC.1